MSLTFPQFLTECPEEACLDALMGLGLRGREITCPACGGRGGFDRVIKRRAYACRACGHYLYPCVGTPFEKSQMPLTQWFFALYLTAGARRVPSARTLRRQTGCTRQAASRIEATLRALAARTGDDQPLERLVEAVEALVAGGALAPASRRGADARLAPEVPATAPAGPARARSIAPALPPVRALLPVVGVAVLAGGLVAGAVTAWRMVGTPGPAESPPSLTLVAEEAIAEEPATAALPVGAGLDDSREGAPPAPSVRLSPVIVNYLIEEERRAPAKPSVKLSAVDRAVYEHIIGEAAAPGPRNPDEILVFGPMRIRRHIVETIVKAARLTGSDPVLLMAIADKESSFATEAQARTSSATGLFQFIEKTWLQVVYDFGARHGLAKEAQSIAWTAEGLTASDAAEKARILELRREPYVSAVLAAEMLKRDRSRIAHRIGRDLTHGETYLVHFLGPDGAQRFMEKVVDRPETVAAELLPGPARANKPIFYSRAGVEEKSLSVAEVHQKFEAMMDLRLDRYRNVDQIAGAAVPVKASTP